MEKDGHDEHDTQGLLTIILERESREIRKDERRALTKRKYNLIIKKKKKNPHPNKNKNITTQHSYNKAYAMV